MENFINFYPTPKELLRKITSTVQWWKIDGILEPEAGKGDIADYIKSERSNLVIDCIEINPELQATLKGKGFPYFCTEISLRPYHHEPAV